MAKTLANLRRKGEAVTRSEPLMDLRLVEGDLLDQDVEVLVNAWNRNLIPWWLLIPQGVSRAIKRKAGSAPFREVARRGMIPLGGAVATGAGSLPFKAIIHVAGINLLWRSSEWSVQESVRNAMDLAKQAGYRSIAFPLIGAGSGGGKAERVQRWMLDELERIDFAGVVVVVKYVPAGPAMTPSAKKEQN
jgi:O-acetyl-ADP-ribose deacetylase (regulator of RNase III)